MARVEVIGIGVQKAATSWVYQCLRAHPGLRAAVVHGREPTAHSPKELHFFSRYWERGYAWYDSFFADGERKNFEFSTTYFHNWNVPERIHAYNPRARLLLCLRDPVDRAVSQHRYEVARGWIPPELYDFQRALARNPAYVEQGKYGSHLRRWLDFFELDQICIVDYDDIQSGPDEVLRTIYRFIGVNPDFRPPVLQARVNVSRKARNAGLARAMHAVWNAAGEPARRALRTTGVPRKLRRANESPVDERWVPEISPGCREELARLFVEENRLLGSLLGRDFSHWC